MLEIREQTLYNAVTPVAVTSSTDATPVVVTATAHGLATGDRVLIFGHTTNLAANGIYKVASATANTFALTDELSGANIAGTGGGAGAGGILVPAPPVMMVSDFRTIQLQVDISGVATTTLKVAGSDGKPSAQALTSPRYDYPNMGGTIAPANPYTFLQIVDGDTGVAVNGATGIAAAAASLNKNYEINNNLKKYITVIPVSWSAGVITVKAIMKNNS